LNNAKRSRRAAIAFALSTLFHVIILTLIVNQASPIYDLPESVAPPMDVRIMEMPEPIPRIVLPPPPKLKVLPPTPTAEPPKPIPPPPTPAPPTPVQAPPKPAAAAAPEVPLPKPAPVVELKPLPAVTPRPEPAPVTAPKVAPAPPAPPTPVKAPAAPTAPSPPAPIRLNIHKPEKEAPSNVATLPLAPAPSPQAPSGGPPTAATSGEPPLGGSRLQGLTPYPYGAMPSGGSGLRGSLVGCANADAVNLSEVERAKCNGRFGASIGSAPALDGMNPAKRSDFDKAAERQDRDLKYRDSTLPPGTERGPHGFGGEAADAPYTVPIGPH